MTFYSLPGLNPEPWTAGTASAGRGRGGGIFTRVHKDAGLAVYQEAVQAAMYDKYGVVDLLEWPIELTFYLWRQQAVYESDAGRKVQRHVADATNMQKALEDALQGVLFANDRDVVHVETWVCEQGPDVDPGIIISAKSTPASELTLGDVDVWSLRRKQVAAARSPRKWLKEFQPGFDPMEVF